MGMMTIREGNRRLDQSSRLSIIACTIFYAIEEKVRQHLVVTAANTLTEGTRKLY